MKRSAYYVKCACGCGAVSTVISDYDPKLAAKETAKLVRKGLVVHYSEDVDADGILAAFRECSRKERQ